MRQYRVRVHSMKTSAAMIGAIHLSGMARMLELAAIEEQMETIQIVTPVFLKEWRGYQDKLQPVLEREALKSDLIVKMEFEKSVFVNLIKRLELVMADFDVDTADAIVSELKTFEYPLEYLPLMEQLYLAVTNLEDATVSSLAEKLIAIEN